MVLVAHDTGRVGIARRSIHVQVGGRWGTIGGTMEPGSLPRETAIRELLEETGYSGQVDLYLIYIFLYSGFRYYNYAGIVPMEFRLNPNCQHSWENEDLSWFKFDELLQLMDEEPESFHFGLRLLFKKAGGLIRQLTLGESPSSDWFRSR